MRTHRMALSGRDQNDLFGSLRDQQQYLMARRDAAKDKKSVTHRLVDTLEVGAGAAGIGVLSGYLGTTSFGQSGIPIGLALGAAGHVVSVLGILPEGYGRHISNVSDGFIAGWLAMWGAGQGSQMRANKSGDTAPIVSGHNGRQYPQLSAAPQPQYSQMGGPAYSQMGASIPGHARSPLSEAEIHAISLGMMPRAA